MHPPPGRRSVRPWMLRALVALAGVGLAGGALPACGTDGRAEHPSQPTLPAVDFRPKLVVAVGDAGTSATPGSRSDPAIRTDPPTVPSGSVVELVNTATGDQRIQAGAAFDTGILRPGEHTTAVVTNPGPDPLDLRLTDVLTGREVGHLVVLPAAPT
jgi:hypothetical protein